MDLEFYREKRVLITGHTGFKGSWMCKVLQLAGAKVMGYSLGVPSDPSLFDLSVEKDKIESIFGDIRDFDKLLSVFRTFRPEIVIHMAAQPLVRDSYENPVYTYEVNVMGTVHVLECIRKTASVRSFVNVTTDKVYRNREWEWGYRENEELNGYDPYSNSKSCSELVTGSYVNSFFGQRKNLAVSTVRAGNVIGGGDFAKDRIIPDCVRAVLEERDITVRNPFSVRPYQHVLEPVMAYLMVAEKQYLDFAYAGNYNIGPEEHDCCTTGDIVELFCKCWNRKTGESVRWVNQSDDGPHEANFLKLDCSRLKKVFGWSPVWGIGQAVEKTVEWSIAYRNKQDMAEVMETQIKEYNQS